MPTYTVNQLTNLIRIVEERLAALEAHHDQQASRNCGVDGRLDASHIHVNRVEKLLMEHINFHLDANEKALVKGVDYPEDISADEPWFFPNSEESVPYAERYHTTWQADQLLAIADAQIRHLYVVLDGRDQDRFRMIDLLKANGIEHKPANPLDPYDLVEKAHEDMRKAWAEGETKTSITKALGKEGVDWHEMLPSFDEIKSDSTGFLMPVKSGRRLVPEGILNIEEFGQASKKVKRAVSKLVNGKGKKHKANWRKILKKALAKQPKIEGKNK